MSLSFSETSPTIILPPSILNHLLDDTGAITQESDSFITRDFQSHYLKIKKEALLMASAGRSDFQDFFPLMAEKLGGDGLIGELCNGFQLLVDSDKGVITYESLKKNAASLGLQGFSDADLYNMIKEGDFDGDGALNQMEFCVLMFRLSPELMEESQFLLEEVLQQEGFEYFDFSL